MEASAATDRLRVLGLGNDLLADDALGVLVAREVRRRHGDRIDVIDTIETGFGLLDHLLDCDRLVVVDAVRTDRAPPGTVSVLGEDDVETVPGCSPHGVGLFETLAAGRALGLPVPRELVIIAVEAYDCMTVGGPMHPAVEQAVGRVTDLVEGLVVPECTS